MVASAGADRFDEGATLVRRDVLRGRLWSASAHRVVRDDDAGLVLACWPGTEVVAASTWL